MEGFAERVEALRRHRGWTKAELARRTGLHTQHLYKILSGERSRVEAQTIIALARAFRISTDQLLGIKELEIDEEHLTAVAS